jgi:hypothetical protein
MDFSNVFFPIFQFFIDYRTGLKNLPNSSLSCI